MSLGTTAGLVLIVSAVWFNAWFAVLAKTFSYPRMSLIPSLQKTSSKGAPGSRLVDSRRRPTQLEKRPS
jgi:hypothetical protein